MKNCDLISEMSEESKWIKKTPEFYREWGNDDLVDTTSNVVLALEAFEAPLGWLML